MPDKTQQQTLSVRITEAMRRRLERARQLAVSRTGEPVSTSEIAKQFLESARDDRLEVVDLFAEPTQSMLQMRRKGDAGVALSRAEWIVLAHFVQVGIESPMVFTSTVVSRDSFVTVLEAFLAVYQMRTSDARQMDGYYLGNLPRESREAPPKRSGRATPDRDVVSRAVEDALERARDSSTRFYPIFAARNLYVVLDGDPLPGAEDLSRALRPFWPRLWRLAARGHYVRTGRPVRESDAEPEGFYETPLPAIREGEYSLNFYRGAGIEFSILLEFPPARGLQYPLAGFPRLADFRILAEAIAASGPDGWAGMYFVGGLSTEVANEPTVWFRARDNRIKVLTSVEDWAHVRRLLERAWALPDIRRAWDALGLEYGEL
jgi:hypothetical protein